jgi:type III pantothenate kinase
MRLIVDSGNTLVKIAVFDEGTIVHKTELEQNTLLFANHIIEKYPIRSAIISDVSSMAEPVIQMLSSEIPVLRMTGTTPVPIKVNYQNAETLGSDRLAAVVFASDFFPGSNVLAIQAGSCITYDLVTETDEYVGGAISPGLEMKLKALNTFTARLPLVKKKEINFIEGHNTELSILSGVINGSIAEIDGMIDFYRNKYHDLNVIMGGGDTFFFDKKLKNRIFAIENLVLKGLNLILEYNVKLEK